MDSYKFVVDKRTELMSIVLFFSQGNDYIKEHFNESVNDGYRAEVVQWFSKFKNHKCFELATKIAIGDEGFCYDNPIRLAFQMDDNLYFNGNIEQYLLTELDNEDLLKEFLFELQNFALDSNFIEFYNQHLCYYNKKIEELEKLFNFKEFRLKINELLKTDLKNQFIINIIPLLTNSNHGFNVDNKIYANIGLVSENGVDIEKFNKGFCHIIIHEFFHSFVNCNTEALKEYIDFDFSNLPKKHYTNKISYVNDTVVRALTIRMREMLDSINVEDFLNRETSFGFKDVKSVYEEILIYEKQNESFNEFFKNFINAINLNNKIMDNKV